jgi:hypothetical protein
VNQKSYRRIVTGFDSAGRSIVADDTFVAEAGIGNVNFWQAGPRGGDLPQAQGGEAFPFVPPPGGSLARVFRLPAGMEGASPEDLQGLSREFGAAIGLAGCQPDTSRHPFMHVTPTTDYIMVLSGDVSLLLDEGEPIGMQPFDVVIQRQTNHAWINTGKTDAFLISVMISRV